jgi:hypothetical protein
MRLTTLLPLLYSETGPRIPFSPVASECLWSRRLGEYGWCRLVIGQSSVGERVNKSRASYRGKRRYVTSAGKSLHAALLARKPLTTDDEWIVETSEYVLPKTLQYAVSKPFQQNVSNPISDTRNLTACYIRKKEGAWIACRLSKSLIASIRTLKE